MSARRRTTVILSAGVFCALVLALVLAILGRVAPAPGPQCGHVCLWRCCALLGVPLELGDVIELSPAGRRGHSLADLARALEAIGLKFEAAREDVATLAQGPFPAIVHFNNPNHFVVVSGMEAGRVHIFDGHGLRRTMRESSFVSR